MFRLSALLLTVLLSQGCMFLLRAPIERGMRVTNERFEVIRLNPAQMTADQKRVFQDSGNPSLLVFEEELGTNKPVQRWIYEKDQLQYTFLDGKKVDYVVVATQGKNPILEAANSDQGPLLIAWQWLQLFGHWFRN